MFNVVLVCDGSDTIGWDDVYQLLRKDGYKVSIVQLDKGSLSADVALARLAVSLQDRPTILVGHGYSGEVIGELADDPRVTAIVYLADVAANAGKCLQAFYAELRTVRELHHPHA